MQHSAKRNQSFEFRWYLLTAIIKQSKACVGRPACNSATPRLYISSWYFDPPTVNNGLSPINKFIVNRLIFYGVCRLPLSFFVVDVSAMSSFKAF